MPYIEPQDKERLDPLITKLCDRVAELLKIAATENEDKREKALNFMTTETFTLTVGYMREIAIGILLETSLNAAKQYQGERKTRYWLIVDRSGIIDNVMDELNNRVMRFCSIPYNLEILSSNCRSLSSYPVPVDAGLLYRGTLELSDAISLLGSPAYHNYDGAYCGLVNYTLTELMPKILLKSLEIGSQRLNWNYVAFLFSFWRHIKIELYSKIATPYEKEQIAKNGDVEIYGRMLELLGAAGLAPLPQQVVAQGLACDKAGRES